MDCSFASVSSTVEIYPQTMCLRKVSPGLLKGDLLIVFSRQLRIGKKTSCGLFVVLPCSVVVNFRFLFLAEWSGTQCGFLLLLFHLP